MRRVDGDVEGVLEERHDLIVDAVPERLHAQQAEHEKDAAPDVGCHDVEKKSEAEGDEQIRRRVLWPVGVIGADGGLNHGLEQQAEVGGVHDFAPNGVKLDARNRVEKNVQNRDDRVEVQPVGDADVHGDAQLRACVREQWAGINGFTSVLR